MTKKANKFMTDKISKKRRSVNMAAIHSKNTKPELIVRKILHQAGFRYFLHKKELPGKPDIYISSHKLALFIHGCFWHSHKRCIDGHLPKSNSMYWSEKLNLNVKRDRKNRANLAKLGITSIIIWECTIKLNDLELTRDRILKEIDKYVKEKNK